MASAAAAKKWRRAFPALIFRPRQPQPGLMHQGGGLQGLTARFPGELVGCEATQFSIDQRQQILRCARLAALDRRENACDLAHKSHLSSAIRIMPSTFPEASSFQVTQSIGGAEFWH